MIRFEVQVLVVVGWFSVHGDMSTAVVIDSTCTQSTAKFYLSVSHVIAVVRRAVTQL